MKISVSAATAMSTACGNRTVLLHGEEKRIGYSVRVHGSAAHQQCHGRSQGQAFGHILSKVASQQPSKIARICVSWIGHPSSNYS